MSGAALAIPRAAIRSPSIAPAAGRAPAVVLLALLAVNTIAPQEWQARTGMAGLLPSDLLLAAALGWAALDLPWRRLDRRTCWVAGGLVAVMLIVLAQEARALVLGRSLSGSGGEARVLLGLGTLFVALPLLADRAGRARLGAGLAGLGLILGLWGVAQSVLGLTFGSPPDLGLSTSASHATAGRTVGMFAFPVAVLCALAALAVGAARTAAGRLVLVATVVLNATAILLAFERTFIVATGLGIVLLAVRTPRGSRLRLGSATVAVLLGATVCVAALNPALLAATGSHLATVAHPGDDASIVYRQTESAVVRARIAASPWTGDGMGAAMRIGRPGTFRPIDDRRYAENGYLWLAWKTGLPAAALTCAVLLAALTAPRRRGLPDAAGRALALGAQASLVTLGVASVTFGSFAQIGIMSVVGVLAACCLTPLPAEGSSA